ncbi:MAG: hypothetical protein JWR35_780 [Marmoricola sp.]|nr:hypothetical protein [Marmoricola sp.]
MLNDAPRNLRSNLDIAVQATHEVLLHRLRSAIAGSSLPPGARDNYRKTDTFLASASRHLAAASAVLLPAVREHLPDSADQAHEFVHQCRRLELALARTKAKLYGSAYAISRPWAEIWREVDQEFRETIRLERQLIDELIDALDLPDLDALASRVHHVELHSPTRPHPYLPHDGLAGRVARSLWAKADGFWDTVEGRLIPAPVKVHDHAHDGLLANYLLGDTHFPDEDVNAS